MKNITIDTQIDNQLFVLNAIKLDIAKFTAEKVSLLREGRKGFTPKLAKIIDIVTQEIAHQRKRAIKLTDDTVNLYQFQQEQMKVSA